MSGHDATSTTGSSGVPNVNGGGGNGDEGIMHCNDEVVHSHSTNQSIQNYAHETGPNVKAKVLNTSGGPQGDCWKKQTSKTKSMEIEEDEAETNRFIETLTSKYRGEDELITGGTETNLDSSSQFLARTIEYLKENVKAGICLICIEDIQRPESVWSCKSCYCMFHLECIQRWAKDSMANVRAAAAHKGFNLPIVWCCPKCRGEYTEEQYPLDYKCFCGKVTNPSVDPWNAPHTCGDYCEKPLQPECGHNCLLLCHSGPCPPCPKQVFRSCFCGQSSLKPMRCFSQSWSCGRLCSKPLACDFHNCPEVCHESSYCPPCALPITLSCKCSNPKPVIISCYELVTKSATLSCGSPCGKLLDCQTHKCEKVCHENKCLLCTQSCPCGKRQVSCSGKGSSGAREKCCEDTCDKVLDCSEHFCSQKCHTGSCGSCLQWVTKRCKCGSFTKELQCSKEFTCTTKCKIIRDCGVHPCNKKCCAGDCPPCRTTCGKTLACGNHKCESICHGRAPCYPCTIKAEVRCRCGKTKRIVPCGSEKKVKPPNCSHLCELKSKCDHPSIQKHKCHFSDCPRCTLSCGKEMGCGHKCPAICHTIKGKRKDCPPCREMVHSKCPVHSTTLVPCWMVNKPCEETCSKLFDCGIHRCEKRCHERIVQHCGECAQPCGKERPNGCQHECPLGCHTGPCSPCSSVAKVMCHCQAETLFVVCSEQNSLSELQKSCKDQCPKKLSCGHRCLSICHAAPQCPELERCRRKVRVNCKCRHLNKEIECYLLDPENKVLECVPPGCNVPKSPVLTAPGSGTAGGSGGKRRARKKKLSEGDKENEQKTVEEERKEKSLEQGGSDSNIKLIGSICGIALLSILGVGVAYLIQH